MSKNFELLQRVGNVQTLFETAIQGEDTVPAAKDEASLALDKETFERIMLNASLPDVFETVTEPLPGTFEEWSDPRPDALGEGKANVSQVDDYATVFRPSENATSWFDDFENFVEKNSGQNAAEGPSLPKAAPEGQELRVPTSPTGMGSTTLVREEARRSFRPKFSPSFQWIEGIKRAANKWERKLPARGSQKDNRIDAIAREEEFKLVQRVFPGTNQGSPRVALFAGLESESGCGSICARAGKILASRAEGPVCVVDANFQTPSLHEYFGVENCKGLAEATVESGPIQNFAQQIPDHDLWLLPSGKSATELRFPTMAEGLRERIKELRDTFRYVVIHSGPLRLQTSAMQLSRWTDGVVLVVEANNTRKEAARRVKDNLAVANVSVLGVVLNNRAFPIPDAIYRRL